MAGTSLMPLIAMANVLSNVAPAESVVRTRIE